MTEQPQQLVKRPLGIPPVRPRTARHAELLAHYRTFIVLMTQQRKFDDDAHMAAGLGAVVLPPAWASEAHVEPATVMAER
jgi:hypothetical protein